MDDLKNLFGDIKRSPLLIAVVVVLAGAALYLWYRGNGSSGSTSGGSVDTSTAGTGPSGIESSPGGYQPPPDKHFHGPPPTPKPGPKPQPQPNPGPGHPQPVPQPNPGNPLIPQGQLPAGNHGMGAYLLWQGTTYTLVPGAGGRLWGVPGKVSVPVAEATPIPPKVLLYAPASYYH